MKMVKNKISIRIIGIVIISSLMYSYAINSFVEVADLFPGGFAGISMLVTRLFDVAGISVSFSLIYMILNVVTTIFVFKYVGKMFACYSILWFTLTSFFTWIMPIQPLTVDPLLLAVFGGTISGLAVALALRNNASSGGVDFIAIYVANRYNHSTWNYVFLFNTCIIVISGMIFGWDKAFYSIIYQFGNTQIISALHHRYKLKTLNIITAHPETVSQAILDVCRHGITRFDGEGVYTHQSRSLLFMVINAYELHDVLNAIKKVDARAFISISTSERIVGNYYQKPLD